MTNGQSWKQKVADLAGLLEALSFSDHEGRGLDPGRGFSLWHEWGTRARDQRRTIFLAGNGASASIASHMAADLAKNAHVHTEVFSDLSLITAISNDMGYEHVFSEPLRRRGQAGDMLVAISSSGRSANILKAADLARELDLTVVTLSSWSAENPLRSRGDLNAWVPASTYGDAETCHAAILHHWMDLMEIKTR